MAIAEVTLNDKYTLASGRIYVTGLQALTRLLVMQRQRDLAAGKNTAGFVSGYQGSPLNNMDKTLAGASTGIIGAITMCSLWVATVDERAMWSSPHTSSTPPQADAPAELPWLNASPQRPTPAHLPYHMPNTPS